MSQTGYVFHRCSCTTITTGNGRRTQRRLHGASCPRRSEDRHGSWWYQTELPRRAGVRRRQLRRGGFASPDAAQAAVDAVAALLAVPGPGDDAARLEIADLIQESSRKGKPLPSLATVRARYRNNKPFQPVPALTEWMLAWLNGRKKLRPSTRVNYETLTRLHLIPYLGELRLDQIRVDHIHHMFEQIEDFNTFIRLVRATGTPEQRQEIKWRKPSGPTTHRRVLSVLRGALQEAMRQQILTFNPATCVELDSAPPPRPLVWTSSRVARWRATGEVPSSVMVWTPQQTGAFLDHITGDDLYLLFHLLVFFGLRRGEVCGLTWPDIDLEEQALHITQQLTLVSNKPTLSPSKSLAGRRHILLDETSSHLLARHHRRSSTDDAFTQSLVFTDQHGQPLRPDKITDRFKALVAEADLPPIRLHDLRHGTATLLLAAGIDMKVIQEILGHSRYTTTADYYTSVLPTLARAATTAITQLVPRRAC